MSGASRAVFSSWSGRYSDNPRAVSDELHRRADAIEQRWLLHEASAPVPAHVIAVPPEGPQADAALAEADLIVSNDVLAHPFAKGRASRYVQTWHGTPLKRIAFDVRRPSFPEAGHYETWLPRDIARWDVLVSPNRFSTDVLRRAFRFDGEVVETGYPRNDVLLSPERDAIRARVRAELELPDHVTAVLYAPTWRDRADFELALDLDLLGRRLGDDVVVLLRAHWLVAASAATQAFSGVRDVTAHPEIADLYLAADVLLTDYSSAMFDFAVTRKPIVFFVHDLAHYRDELRGFYFDLEAEAPGPLLATSEAVAGALTDLDEVRERHAEAYERFHARFCHLEDGRSSARVVDLLLGA